MKKFYTVFCTLFIVFQLSAQVFTDSNLPIVIINTDIDPVTGEPTEIVDEPKVPATMKIIYHTDGSRNYVSDQNTTAFLNYKGRIGIEFRGSSSQLLPKKPYGLKTMKNDDISSNKVEILGMPKESSWVLNSLAYDQSLIRDYLSYDLARNIGDYAARGRYCEVVINGDYKGLYIFMEKVKVDSNRINIADIGVDDNNSPEVTGGYFTKCDKVDPDETVAWSYPTTTPDDANFLHEQPKQEDVTTQQNDYIKSVFDSLLSTAVDQNSSIINGYPSVIDIPTFVDFMLLNELASNVDAYQYSTFFHKDRGGKLRAGPIWDFNLTYGNDIYGTRSGTDVWQFDNDDNVGPAFWKGLFDNPEFHCYLSKRWNELTANGEALNYATLNTEIDLLGNLLAEAKVREHQRWNTLPSYDEEILNLKSWIQDRITFLNSDLIVTGDCTFPDTPDLVISKINYHPKDTAGLNEPDYEFIAITNNSDETIVLTGMYFKALGVSFQFPAGSIINPGEIIYLVNNIMVFEDFYGVTAFGEYLRDLSNKSQQLELADAFGNTIDSVTYADTTPWPVEADGLGAYLLLNDLNSDNSQAVNWSASSNYGLCNGFTIWEGASLGWNHGTPDNGKEVYISENYSSSLGNIEACSLKVLAGNAVTINAGEYIKIENDITVNGDLFIANEGSIVQTNDNASVSNNGNIIVEKITPSLNDRDFMIVGSPMTAETNTNVHPNAIQFRDHHTANFTPNPDVAAQDALAENFADDNGDNWLQYNGTINPGEGYLVIPQETPNIPAPASYTFNYTQGTLNNGVVDFDVLFGDDQNDSPNMLANPYPSAIDANLFMEANDMVDMVYFWEHINSPADYPGYNANNYDMGDISLYSYGALGGVGVAAANGGSTPNAFIASGQGFAIKASTAGTAEFNNSMRVTGPNDTYRTPEDRDIVWLNVRNETYGLGSTMAVGFSAKATDGFDPRSDVKRLATPVSLYSELETGEQLAIQARGDFNNLVEVPLSFTTHIEEKTSYTISLSDLEFTNIKPGAIYLRDNLKGKTVNITRKGYIFRANSGTYQNRFTLFFSNSNRSSEDRMLGSDGAELNFMSVTPNPTKGILNIESPGQPITSVQVFDLRGRLLIDQKINAEEACQINLSALNASVYFVKIQTENGTITKRIVKE